MSHVSFCFSSVTKTHAAVRLLRNMKIDMLSLIFFLFSQEVIQNLRSYNSPKDVDDEHVHIYDAQVC